jgi:alpha/beta superfamily hydrolase
MNDEKTMIPTDFGGLEAVIWNPPMPHPYGVVVCHPHPLYGGDMSNNVVASVFQLCKSLQIPVIRFNFRGVGHSKGGYGDGWGEQQDVESAITYLQTAGESPPQQIIVIGYSFGAAVAAGIAAHNEAVVAYIAISHPMTFMKEFTPELTFPKPKFFLMGDRDDFTAVSDFQATLEMLPSPVESKIERGIDHFWNGGATLINLALKPWLQQIMTLKN